MRSPRRLCLLFLICLPVLLAAGLGASSSRAELVAPSTARLYDHVPGALPANFHYHYNHLSPGWPVAPRRGPHPIRGSFLDPRGTDYDIQATYHFGVDIAVNDSDPEQGAPPGRPHRVYALDSGNVHLYNTHAKDCFDHHLEAGHFAYWHVWATVRNKQAVRAGQPIGWTCQGAGHVHLSEWQRWHGKLVWVNPLHRGGALRPYYHDWAQPQVGPLLFVSPPSVPWQPRWNMREPDSAAKLSDGALNGLVELRARVVDPQSFFGFLPPRCDTGFSPYRVGVTISDEAGKPVLSRTTFQADQMPQTPYLLHYAPGTAQNLAMSGCLRNRQASAGFYWLRPLSREREEYWDTRQYPDGLYRVSVYADDIMGNRGEDSAWVRVDNETTPTPPPTPPTMTTPTTTTTTTDPSTTETAPLPVP